MRTVVFLTALIFLVCLHVSGQELNPDRAPPQSPPNFESSATISLDSQPHGIWADGIGNGMTQGAMEAEAAFGAGIGIPFGSEQHNLAITELRLGRVVSRLLGRGHWFQGNFMVLGEILTGAQFSPDTRYFVGIAPVLRYEIATGTRWVPFIDGGAGVTLTDIGRPDLGGNFEFNLQAGLGVKYYFRDNMSVMFQDHYLHFSSGGIYNPNHGVNANVFLLGASWAF